MTQNRFVIFLQSIPVTLYGDDREQGSGICDMSCGASIGTCSSKCFLLEQLLFLA